MSFRRCLSNWFAWCCRNRCFRCKRWRCIAHCNRNDTTNDFSFHFTHPIFIAISLSYIIACKWHIPAFLLTNYTNVVHQHITHSLGKHCCLLKYNKTSTLTSVPGGFGDMEDIDSRDVVDVPVLVERSDVASLTATKAMQHVTFVSLTGFH